MSRAFPLGRLFYVEAVCIVPEDPGEVVHGARPITAEDRRRMHEQHLRRLTELRKAAGLPTAAEAARTRASQQRNFPRFYRLLQRRSA